MTDKHMSEEREQILRLCAQMSKKFCEDVTGRPATVAQEMWAEIDLLKKEAQERRDVIDIFRKEKAEADKAINNFYDNGLKMEARIAELEAEVKRKDDQLQILRISIDSFYQGLNRTAPAEKPYKPDH